MARARSRSGYQKRKSPTSTRPVPRPVAKPSSTGMVAARRHWMLLAGAGVALIVGLTVVLTLAFSGALTPKAPNVPLPTLPTTTVPAAGTTPSTTTVPVAGTTPSTTTTTFDVTG